MAEQKKSGIFFAVIAVCIFITQSIAYFSTPEKVTNNKKYILNILALYTIIMQWFAFIHAGGFFGNKRTEKYYDLTGSLTFLSTLALSLDYVSGTMNTRQILLSLFVAIWSTRLDWFLFTRIHNNNGFDSRFILIKQFRPRFMMVWTLQGVWTFITLLPVLIINQSDEAISLGLIWDFIGIPLWITGLSIEVIADFQKSNWQRRVEKKNQFINTGLWTISRHPNYFGEIILWIGISLIAFGGLSAKPRAFLTFLSPIFVAFLLIFVSGISLLEKKADKKFGKDNAYQLYKESTPVLIPFVGRTGDALF